IAVNQEVLPAIVNVALSIGVQRMMKQRVIVQKLQAVETLGCATVICTDKTGTITENQMAVTDLWLAGHSYTYQALPEGNQIVDKLLRSEEHTSELQSRFDLVCRLLLEK